MKSANVGYITGYFGNFRFRFVRNFCLAGVIAFSIFGFDKADSTLAVESGDFTEAPLGLFVTNNNDSGPGSLRDVVLNSPAGSAIAFDAAVTGTITLTSGEININKNLTIMGPGAGVLAVSGNNSSRVFSITSSTVTISGLTLRNGNGVGITNGVGGAVFVLGAALNLNDSMITSSNSGAGTAGGLAAGFSTVNLTRVTVSGNIGSNVSGIYLQDGSTVIQDSTISGNSGASGEGVRNSANSGTTTLTIRNSTISGNTTTIGNSAVRSEANAPGISVVSLINCTVTNNSTSGVGQNGAIWHAGGGGHTLTLTNSIVSGNTSGGVSNDIEGTAVASSAFNLIGTGGGLTNGVNGNIVGLNDPRLEPLANNGGPTQTHSLLGTSPAIDKGQSSGSNTDQRGLTRPVDLPSYPNAAGGDAADIGAFEAQSAAPTPTATGTPSCGTTVSYTGPAVAIPDLTSVNINLPVSGVGTVADLNFRFDTGGACNATVGNTNAAMDHTFIGDLIFRLTPPDGSPTVAFQDGRGGNRDNICMSLLDDDGGFPNISTLTNLNGSPQTGDFAPETTGQFSLLDGENGNGTWTLNVSDFGNLDTGSMRRFSLIFNTGQACGNQPTLGTYANTSVALGANTTITPSATPTETTSINVTTNTNFKGRLEANPVTGVVRVTNAHPAGVYPVTVKAFGPGGMTTRTFDLTVTSGTICSGTTSFGGTTNVTVGQQPRSVAVGDFNNDGMQDVASAGLSDTVSIRLGDGAGGFSGTTNVLIGSQPWALAVADFNNDGKQDIAATNNASSTVSILLGDGLGGFTVTTTVAGISVPLGVTVGDFNADGKQDFATASSGSNDVSIRLGDGLGGFSSATSVAAGGAPIAVAVGDFNNDGKQDIAVANNGSSTVSIRPGDGLGGFSGTTNVPVGFGPYSVAVGDFNNDGKQDIATANQASNTVSIRLGDGLGGFSGTTDVAVDTSPLSVAVGDFNNDGKQDIATASQITNTVSIRLGDGLGGINGAIEVPVAASPRGVAVGDFNNDGKQDIAAASYDANRVSIRLGNCVGSTPTNTSTATPTNTPTPVPVCIPNIISWWKGENNPLDVVGGNNGTLQNGVSFAAGEVGQAFSFDGVDDAVLIGNPASLNLTSAITVEAWINTNSFPDGTLANVVAKWGFDASVDSYLLGLIRTGGVIRVIGGIGNGATGDPGIIGGTVSTNTWTHIAMTYDSATGSNLLYLNGAQVASRTRNGGIFSTVTPVYIGREGSAQGRFFNGSIDEPTIYNRALTSTEILAIYNASSAGKCSVATATPTSTPVCRPQFPDGNASVRRQRRPKNLEEMQEMQSVQTENAGSILPDLDSPDVGGVDPGFAANVTDGSSRIVSLATQPDGKFLVGGTFSSINGVTRRGIDRFNADGTRDETFNPGGMGANGAVFVILILPDDKIMIGGFFTTYNGSTAQKIIRLNPDGTLDTTFTPQGTSVNTGVQDMIIQPDGKILVSSSFTSFNGVVRNAVARLNADGTLDTNFNPNVMSGASGGFVEELILQPDGKIIIGGVFTTVGGTPRNSLARLNSDGTVDANFNVGSGVQYSDGSAGGVYGAERQPDGKILIGGDFDSYNGVPRNASLARINTDGSLDAPFNPVPPPGDGGNAEFFAVQPDGKILVSGFSGFAGFPTGTGILRFNADGTTDTTFNAGVVDDFGYVLALQADGKILLGGFFRQFGGQERRNIVRLNPDGTADNFTCAISSEAAVNTIVRQPDGKLLIGGRFRRINGVARRNIARLNADGTIDLSFDPGSSVAGFNAPFVYSIAVQADDKILVGGLFTGFSGAPRNNIVRLNSNGSIDCSFVYDDATALVRDIEVRSGGKIVLAGFFNNQAQGVNSGIVKLNSDGSYDPTAVGSGASGTVTRIIPYTDGSLKAMIVGAFTNYNGTPINRIARINDDGSLDTSFNPGTGFNSAPFDVALMPNTQMYVGGQFTSFNGVANIFRIARLNSNGTLDANFSTGTGTGFNGSVLALSVEGADSVLAGGLFNSYNGSAVNQLTLLNANGTRDTGFTAQLNAGAANVVERILRQPDGTVMVGGIFTGIGGVPRNSIARLNANPTGSCVSIPIAYGQSINGSLNSSSCLISGPTDVYGEFSGTAGQQIAITLDSIGTNGVQPVSLELRSTGGTQLITSNSGTTNARIPATGFFTLPSNNGYSIRVSSPTGSFGDYALSLTLQPGAACNYTVAPTATNVSPSGGTFFFDVLSGVGCPSVTAATGANSGHITIVSNTGGRVTFNVAAYGGTTDRTGTIVVNGGPVHTITQYGVTPPGNDNFAQATLLSLGFGSINGRNTNATGEPNEPPHGGSPAARSVWYRWTAPSSQLYSFTTSGSYFDTVMAIYTGMSVGALTRIAENDDTTNFDQTSKINFRATAGTEYYIAIDGKNGQSGSIVLTYGPYRRLYRLYLQNFNGFASPIAPDVVTARREDNTGPVIPGDLISLGVYEFDLPDDNSRYIVTITGPAGITWVPNTYLIDNSSARFNELMLGATGGGQNQTSNPTNTVPRHFFGFIHGIGTQQQLTPLRVRIASTGSASAVPPKECGPPLSTAPVLVSWPGGSSPMRTLYDCLTQPNTIHQIVPNAPQTAFQVPVLELPVINADHLPTSAEAITATTSATFNIGGRVLAGAQGLAGANIDITSGTLTIRVTSDANGNYLASNLAPGLVYTLRASLDGFIFHSETVDLQSANVTRDITAQTCTFALAGNGNFTTNGGQGEFSVTASDQTCGWTAVSGSPWISILSGSSVGNGTTQFSVQANTGAARQGSINVGGQNFTINQASSCSYSLSTPSQISFPSTGGSSSFIVTTPTECSWIPAANDYCMVGLSGSGPGNGTVNFTVLPNRGIARSATMSVGGQTVTVNQAAAAGLHRARFDFDGDGRSDVAVYRPSEGFWYFDRPGSPAGFEYTYFGISEDRPVAADYDGDRKADVAVFRPSTSFWYRLDSSTGAFIQQAFGTAGDIPVPNDYDGDGHDNIAIFRPSTGTWYTSLDPGTNYGAIHWGAAGDVPAPADFDGDGRTDVAVFRPSAGFWYLNSSTTGFFAIQFGTAGDVPVPADYDGDGKADIAVYRPSDSIWYRLNSSNGQFVAVYFGLPGDKPVQADYNGDKRADIAVFRPSNGGWYMWSCMENTVISATAFGLSTDIPIPNPLAP